MARKAKKSEIDEAKVAPDADDAGPEPATATTGDDHDPISTDSTTTAKVDAPPPTPSKPHKKSAKKSKRTSTKKSKKKSEGDDSASSKKKKKKEKRQFPPPFPDLIYGYHANDVLNGRGASVNVHPGNKKFRDLCISRKEEFNSARNIQKRDIAIEIVQTVLEWNPPGRFLERTNDSNHRNHSNNNPGDAEVEAYFNEVNAAEVLTGASALYFNQMGISARKNSKFMRELGPWKDMGMERAIQKVCGVIRDHKRPDRLALQAMALSKVKNVVARKTIDNPSPNDETDDTVDASSSSPKKKLKADNDDDATGIVPTDNDVLLGRGAFINDHSGNRLFRTLALEHKTEFDAGNATEKREISTKVVQLTKDRTPPGRFLKRASSAVQSPICLPDGNYELPPRGLEGPWEEVPEEQAFAKAMQTLRDLKKKVPTATTSETMTPEETQNELAV